MTSLAQVWPRTAYGRAAAGLFGGVALLLLLYGGSVISLLLVAAAVGAAAGLILVQFPLTTLAIAIPVRVLPDYFRFDPPYTPLVYLTLLLALAAWMLDALVKRSAIVWDHVLLTIALYIVWGSITILWAPEPMAGVRWMGTYTIGLLIAFLILNEVRDIQGVDVLMRILALMGWIYIIVGFIAISTGHGLGAGLKDLGANSNQYGMFLMLMLPGIIWQALRAPPRTRLVYTALSYVYIGTMLALIALTGSRGSALSLLVVIAALVLWKPVRPWGLTGLTAIVSMLVAAPFLVDTLVARFLEDETAAGEFGGRLLLWQAALELISENVWTGIGAGNGPQQLHDYIASLTSYYNERNDLPAHNPLLEVGIQTGVPGMVIYALIPVLAVRTFLRGSRRPVMRRGIMGAYYPLVLSSTVGYGLSWMKSGGMENDPSFFILMALLLLPAHVSDGGEAVAEPTAPRPLRT